MDSYQKLRAQARLKRDAAIQAAHDQYQATLRTIQDLRHTLGTEGSIAPVRKAGNFAKGRKAMTLIRQVMPRHCEFTLAELVKAIKEVAPDQELHDSTLRGLLRRLEDQGTVERVRRAGDGQVIWMAGSDAAEPAAPVAAMSLPDAAAAILGERGPLRVKELAVAIQARGCRVGASPKVLTESLAAALRDNSKRFAGSEDGRWGLC